MNNNHAHAAALVSDNNWSDDDDEDEIVHEKTRTLFEAVDHRTQLAEQEGRVICVDTATTTTTTTPIKQEEGASLLDPTHFQGRRVYKHFEAGWFFGTVQNIVDDVDTDDVWYHILYDDNDREDVDWTELKTLLEQWELHQRKDPVWAQRTAAQRQQKRSMTKPPRLAKAVTPSPVKVKREVKVKQEPRDTARNTSTTTAPRAQVNLQRHLGNDAPPVDVKVKMEKLSKKARAQDPFRACEWDYEIAWMKQFAEWLEDHDKISRQNARTILRQVTLLAKGAGIGYKHWPKSVVYLPGTVVDLNFNFDSMLLKAKWYEHKYGEDKGHGWLLRHPLKKLQRYQQYCRMVGTVDPFQKTA